MASTVYIDGWLQVKRKPSDKYETFWCVLKPTFSAKNQLLGAELQFFVERNMDRSNYHGSVHINFLHGDSVALLDIKGNKKNKCKFSVLFQIVDHSKTFNKINQVEMNFATYEEILRERWMYALCDLVGNMKPPDDLPTMHNGKLATRPRVYEKPKNLKSVRKLSLAEIMAPVPLPEQTGPFIPFDRKSSTQMIPSNKIPSPISPITPGPIARNPLIKHCAWYYGNINRKMSHDLLAKGLPGAYLLRDSSQTCAEYALSYKDTENKIQHVLVLKKSDNQYSMDEDSILAPTPTKACQEFLMKYYSTLSCQPLCNISSTGNSNPATPKEKKRCQPHLIRQSTVPANIGRPQPPIFPRPRYENMTDDVRATKVEEDEENGYLQLTNLQNMNLIENQHQKGIFKKSTYSKEPLPPPIDKDAEKSRYLVAREHSDPGNDTYLVVDKEYFNSKLSTQPVQTEGDYVRMTANTQEHYVEMSGNIQEEQGSDSNHVVDDDDDNQTYLKMSSPKSKAESTGEPRYVKMDADTQAMTGVDDDGYLKLKSPSSRQDETKKRNVMMRSPKIADADGGDDKLYLSMELPKQSHVQSDDVEDDLYLKMSLPTKAVS